MSFLLEYIYFEKKLLLLFDKIGYYLVQFLSCDENNFYKYIFKECLHLFIQNNHIKYKYAL